MAKDTLKPSDDTSNTKGFSPRKPKQGRKKVKPEKNRRENQKTIGFTIDEINDIKKNAKKMGMRFTPFIRYSAINFTTKNTKKKSKLQDVLSPEVNRRTLMELAKVGNNLNQIARAMNQGRFVFPDDIKHELSKTIAILNQLAKELNLK